MRGEVQAWSRWMTWGWRNLKGNPRVLGQRWKEVPTEGVPQGLHKFSTMTIQILNPTAHAQIKELGIRFKISYEVFQKYHRILSHL